MQTLTIYSFAKTNRKNARIAQVRNYTGKKRFRKPFEVYLPSYSVPANSPFSTHYDCSFDTLDEAVSYMIDSGYSKDRGMENLYRV